MLDDVPFGRRTENDRGLRSTPLGERLLMSSHSRAVAVAGPLGRRCLGASTPQDHGNAVLTTGSTEMSPIWLSGLPSARQLAGGGTPSATRQGRPTRRGGGASKTRTARGIRPSGGRCRPGWRLLAREPLGGETLASSGARRPCSGACRWARTSLRVPLRFGAAARTGRRDRAGARAGVPDPRFNVRIRLEVPSVTLRAVPATSSHFTSTCKRRVPPRSCSLHGERPYRRGYIHRQVDP
jgi:hypothetical protein